MSAHPRVVTLVGRAVEAVAAEGPLLDADVAAIPVPVYTDPARLERERALFRRLPIPIAHASELELPSVSVELRATASAGSSASSASAASSTSAVASREASGASSASASSASAAGPVLVREVDGVSLILTRGADGKARAFKNACRHRGVRILREDCPAKAAKAFVCPYHGWTYSRDGALMHVPHACAFEPAQLAGRNLAPVHLEERHGILWATLEPPASVASVAAVAAVAAARSVAGHLGELDDEVAALGLEEHVVVNRVTRVESGNWKMLVEGFLDGYHIRTLHRDTVYRFFHDAKSAADRVGPHVRSASARRAKAGVTAVRELATFNFNVFPATTLIAHPDWTSLVTVQPRTPSTFLWTHLQLVPRAALAPAADAARAHFDRSFALIDGEVFANEDLRMCAEAQRGLETGANSELLFGRLESPAVWFHRALAEALGDESARTTFRREPTERGRPDYVPKPR